MSNKSFSKGDIVTWDEANWVYESVRQTRSLIRSNIGLGPFVCGGINAFGHAEIAPLNPAGEDWDAARFGPYTVNPESIRICVFLDAIRKANNGTT